jgi:uncharacterized repeat protein (TIGR04138 family)
MQKLEFADAVDRLIATDLRYTRDAYYFLRDALDHTVKHRKRQLGENGHVTGQQLCEGIRTYAVKQFGPMVPTVFSEWGITKTDDFGDMVWSLIELDVFGKTATDRRDDFNGVYAFHDAFVVPYLPAAMPPRSPRLTPGPKATAP